MSSAETKLIGDGFLSFLKKEGKLDLLPQIISYLKTFESKEKEIFVYSMTDLPLAVKKRLQAILEKKYGLIGKMVFETDKSLLGGIKIVCGDKVIDLSANAQVESLIASL